MTRNKASKKLLLISYVPLLNGKAGQIYDLENQESIQAIIQQIKAGPTGQAECCFWIRGNEDRVSPVLVIEQAAEIAEHLIEWADHDPTNWFKVFIKERHGKYALVLLPMIKHSRDRFRFAHLIEGNDQLDTENVEVITIPLHFVSNSFPTYTAIKDHIGPTVNVGLVDTSQIDWVNPFNLDPTCINYLGEFTIGDSRQDNVDGYLDGLLDETTEEPNEQSQFNPAESMMKWSCTS